LLKVLLYIYAQLRDWYILILRCLKWVKKKCVHSVKVMIWSDL